VSGVKLASQLGRIVILDFDAFPCVFEMAEVPSSGWHEGIEVLFERGRLSIALPPPLLEMATASVELERMEPVRQAIQYSCPRSTAFRLQAQAFVDDILQQREPRASGADSVSDLVLAESIWRRGLQSA